MKKEFKILIACAGVAVWIFGYGAVHAAEAGTASSSSPIEKAIESVKDSIDNLVTAKDDESEDTLELRIETYRKVIDLALAEAKDLKVKLIAAEETPEEIADWKAAAIETLTAAAKYYDAEKEALDEESSPTLERIRELATSFKKERDAKYVGTVNEVRDLLLIDQQGEAVSIAQARAKKVADDVAKLQKARAKNAERLASMLAEANQLIKTAANERSEALKLFIDLRLPAASSTAATSTASSSASTTEVSFKKLSNTASSTGTSTASSTPEIETVAAPTPRELVTSSLSSIKAAYKVFLDMSALVKSGTSAKQ